MAAVRNVVIGESFNRSYRRRRGAWRDVGVSVAVVDARTEEKHAQKNEKGRVVSRPLVLRVCFVEEGRREGNGGSVNLVLCFEFHPGL